MSEEEIIDTINSFISQLKEFENEQDLLKAIQGLLDLYNKEKVKNAKLKKEIKDYKYSEDISFKCLEKTKYMQNFISKDKIKEFITKKMKFLYVDSCAEDSGKYSAYMEIRGLLEE